MASKGWGEKGAWVIVWQPLRRGVMYEFLWPVGIERYAQALGRPRPEEGPANPVHGVWETKEDALGAVEVAARTFPGWRMRWRGGVFRAVQYDEGSGIVIGTDGSMVSSLSKVVPTR